MEGGIGLVLLLFVQSGVALEIYGPATQRARRGSDALIPCSFTVDKPPVDQKYFAVFWYFKGNEILSYKDVVKTLDPRISLNTDSSLNGDASLSISRVMISDKGVYTCSIHYSPERKEKEVTLHVQASPEIKITEKLVVTNRQSVLRAAITGFYPWNINVKWFRDGETLNNYAVSTPQRNQDGTYSVTSTVTIIPTEEDKLRTFSCRVQQESLSEHLHEDFQLEFAAPPEVKVTGRHVDINKESVLSCLITGFYPADIDVKWFKDGEIMDHVLENTRQRNPNGTYSVTSTVTITPTEEDKHRTFSCRVQHEALSQPVQGTFQLEYAGLTCEDSTRWPVILGIVVAVILLIVIAGLFYTYQYRKRKREKTRTQKNKEESSSLIGASPHVEDIEILNQLQCNQEVTLQCNISNYYPDNPKVTWHRYDHTTFNPDRKSLPEGYQIPDLQHVKQWDDTYSCTARLVFTPSPESDDGAVFLCRVKHPSIKGRIEKISKPLQIMGASPPQVEDIEILNQLQCNQEVTLQCNISSYYPKNLKVTWHKYDQKTQQWTQMVFREGYRIPILQPEQQQDHTYSCTARLIFIPSLQSHHGAEFICKVQHPSLKEPIERRSKPLQIVGYILHVEDIEIPDQIQCNQEVTLRCNISNYCPKNLTVTWLKYDHSAQQTVPVNFGEGYQTPDLQHEKHQDLTYSCTARLVFSPFYDRDYMAEFICRVEHPSLEEPIERITGPLQVMGQHLEEVQERQMEEEPKKFLQERLKVLEMQSPTNPNLET